MKTNTKMTIVLLGVLIMSIFSPASIKIRDLLGLTARGQTTKANSLPVTLASDEDAIAIAGTVPVSGPLTDTELRATAVPVSVTGETGEPFARHASHTYAAVHGQVTDIDLIAGKTYDWYASRGASDGDPTDTLTTNALVADYFSAGDPVFNGDPIWIYIPINATVGSAPNLYGGYYNFSAYIKNSLAEDLTITLYAVPDKAKLAFGVPKSPITDGLDYWQIATQVLTSYGGAQIFGPNGISVGAAIDRPIGWLVIKAEPAADPNDGYWTLAVQRSR